MRCTLFFCQSVCMELIVDFLLCLQTVVRQLVTRPARLGERQCDGLAWQRARLA